MRPSRSPPDFRSGWTERGGWGDTTIVFAGRPVVDVITGRQLDGGTVHLADLLDRYPVALLAPAR